MQHQNRRKLDQIGIVVSDLDATIHRLINGIGVGPWTVFRSVPLKGHYRGEATEVIMDVGLGYQGDIQIELIQVRNDTPSPYQQDGDPAVEVLHHLAWMVDDLDAAIADGLERGLSVEFQAESPGTRVAYLSSTDDGGLLFEYIESAQTRELIREGIAASKDWDGTNPIRVLG